MKILDSIALTIQDNLLIFILIINLANIILYIIVNFSLKQINKHLSNSTYKSYE